MSYGIQDRQEIQSSIEMDQFERLFFDNLNGDFTEEVQDYNYNSVDNDNFYFWFEMNELKIILNYQERFTQSKQI